jgi:molecular chaperone IbpA
MTVFDLSPLFRTAIGFDRVASMLDAAGASGDASYPPYNIKKTGRTPIN